MSGYVFPQFNDYDDPENFAFHAGHPDITDYVADGLSITADFGANTFDITSGKLFVSVASATGSASGETRHTLTYGVYVDAETGVSLNSGVNYIWIDPNINTQDSPQIVVETQDSAPSNAALKVAEIDTSSDTVNELNRGLVVTNAENADTVDGQDASAFATTSSVTENDILSSLETLNVMNARNLQSFEYDYVPEQTTYSLPTSGGPYYVRLMINNSQSFSITTSGGTTVGPYRQPSYAPHQESTSLILKSGAQVTPGEFSGCHIWIFDISNYVSFTTVIQTTTFNDGDIDISPPSGEIWVVKVQSDEGYSVNTARMAATPEANALSDDWLYLTDTDTLEFYEQDTIISGFNVS